MRRKKITKLYNEEDKPAYRLSENELLSSLDNNLPINIYKTNLLISNFADKVHNELPYLPKEVVQEIIVETLNIMRERLILGEMLSFGEIFHQVMIRPIKTIDRISCYHLKKSQKEAQGKYSVRLFCKTYKRLRDVF